ncbi:DUF1592 domain-containing protein [bacterium]|nr:DUF1592 domain-containing protein [bacterium]
MMSIKVFHVKVLLFAFILKAVPLHGSTNNPLNTLRQQIVPFLEKYCYDCHGDGSDKGDLAFDSFASENALFEDKNLWMAVLDNVRAGLMPPHKAHKLQDQPTESEIDLLADWVKYGAFAIDSTDPDPGFVVTRRLNRIEYQNTVRDLLGIEFKAEIEFPPDDTGNGFDNNGEVLTVSTLLIEKYLNAAEKIVERVMAKESKGDSIQPYARIFTEGPIPSALPARDLYSTKILARFAKQAFRRPVEPSKLSQLVRVAHLVYSQPDRTFEEGIGHAMMTVLSSPLFLYRIEEVAQTSSKESFPGLDEYSLASRLSYFLWSTMPDEDLMQLADRGDLRKELSKQVMRMLKDPRTLQGIVKHFTGQWLQARDVITVEINGKAVLGKGPVNGNRKTKYDFDGKIRRALQTETEMFFEYVLLQDRSVLDFIDSNYTFLNEQLAEHYDIPGVKGENFRQVELSIGSARGGVLTQGTVLAVTSNPTRTSPVKRGVFILENFLGTPPPPPPPDIPELETVQDKLKNQNLTTGEMLALHRQQKICRSCHDRMDPIGLAFENFIPMGNWRQEEMEKVIDSSGQLITGEVFSDVGDLKKVLATDRKMDFYRCLTKKMLSYALGRGLDYRDTHVIDRITNRLDQNNGEISALIHGIIESAPFQKQGTQLSHE